METSLSYLGDFRKESTERVEVIHGRGGSISVLSLFSFSLLVSC